MKTLFDEDQPVAVDRDIRDAFRYAYPQPRLRYDSFRQLRCASSSIPEASIMMSRDPMSVIDYHVGLLRHAARGSGGQIAFDINRDLMRRCYVLTATWVHHEDAV
jgi:hypothetical protein